MPFRDRGGEEASTFPLSVRTYERSKCPLLRARNHNANLNSLWQAVRRAGGVIPEAPGAGAVGSRHPVTECTRLLRGQETNGCSRGSSRHVCVVHTFRCDE